MLTVHVLGSGSGAPTARRDTTALLVQAPDGPTLVDCPGGVVHKLARAGVALDRLTRVVFTHDHVDHVYGFPHLLHAMGVCRGGDTLDVHAPQQTLDTLQCMVQLHRLEGAHYPVLNLRAVPAAQRTPVVRTEQLRITASPTEHDRETICLRFDTELAALGHSSDTALSSAVAGLMSGVDLLLHDCGGLQAQVDAARSPHASARDAGEIAAQADVGALRLIHLSRAAELDEPALVSEAGERYSGSVGVAYDGAIYRLPRSATAPAPVGAGPSGLG